MSNKGPCMQCKIEKPIFLHYVYHRGNALEFCTSCLLALFPGAFCPICFRVYENEDLNSSLKPFNCSMCPARAHFSCVYFISASTSTSASSSSIPPAHYICPSCSDPNFKYFNCQRDEITQSVCIDKHLASQLLAASIISQRCMAEAAHLCRLQVEIRAKEAAEAHKAAKKALERLAELTMAAKQQNEDDSVVISSGSSNEESDGEENSGEENSGEEIYNEGTDSEEINNEGICSEESSGEESD